MNSRHGKTFEIGALLVLPSVGLEAVSHHYEYFHFYTPYGR